MQGKTGQGKVTTPTLDPHRPLQVGASRHAEMDTCRLDTVKQATMQAAGCRLERLGAGIDQHCRLASHIYAKQSSHHTKAKLKPHATPT